MLDILTHLVVRLISLDCITRTEHHFSPRAHKHRSKGNVNSNCSMVKLCRNDQINKNNDFIGIIGVEGIPCDEFVA